MLRTVLLVTVTWTAVSLLFCLAWSRPYRQRRALAQTSLRAQTGFARARARSEYELR